MPTHRNGALAATQEAITTSPGNVEFVVVTNLDSTDAAYLLMYDAGSSVTVGTTTPEPWGIVHVEAGTSEKVVPVGEHFLAGLRIAATQEPGTGTTAPTTALEVKIKYGTRA